MAGVIADRRAFKIADNIPEIMTKPPNSLYRCSHSTFPENNDSNASLKVGVGEEVGDI